MLEQAIVHRQQSADRPEQLERIYLEHHRLVRAVVVGRGVPSAAVDDVVHDAFLKIYGRLDARPPTIPMHQWVAAITRNVAFSHRRSATRRSQRVAKLPRPSPTPPLSADTLDARRAWAVVVAFLDQIPLAQREVFVLCQLQGLPAAEVAGLLGCSRHTVGSRLRLARRKFAQHFPEAAGLGDHAALLHAAARGATPTPQERRRAVGALVAQLGGLEATSAVLSLPALGWAAVGGVLSAALVLGAVLMAEKRQAVAPTPVATAVVEPTPVSTKTAETPAVAHASAETAVPEAVRHRPPAVGPAVHAMPKDPIRTNASGRRTRPERATEADSPDDDLAAQTRLLKRARAALDAGDPTAAATLLRAHAPEFSTSSLRPEHERLQLAVECALGHHDAAAVLARRIHGIRPPTPLCPE